MSFDVSVAGIGMPTDVSALKSFKDELNLAFSLDHMYGSLLNVPLNKVPAAYAASAVSYTGPAASWSPAGSPIRFGLSGDVGGKVEVLNSGSVCDYTDGLDKPTTKEAPLAQGFSYLKLSLDFSLAAENP